MPDSTTATFGEPAREQAEQVMEANWRWRESRVGNPPHTDMEVRFATWLIDAIDAARKAQSATGESTWITCPATGEQCNDFCDPGKGDRCAESGQSFDQSAIRETCAWEQDEDGNYHTGCGHIFFFDTGTAEENEAKFCLYCGGHLQPTSTKANQT